MIENFQINRRERNVRTDRARLLLSGFLFLAPATFGVERVNAFEMPEHVDWVEGLDLISAHMGPKEPEYSLVFLQKEDGSGEWLPVQKGEAVRVVTSVKGLTASVEAWREKMAQYIKYVFCTLIRWAPLYMQKSFQKTLHKNKTLNEHEENQSLYPFLQVEQMLTPPILH